MNVKLDSVILIIIMFLLGHELATALTLADAGVTVMVALIAGFLLLSKTAYKEKYKRLIKDHRATCEKVEELRPYKQIVEALNLESASVGFKIRDEENVEMQVIDE